jgi:hypothetical protein
MDSNVASATVQVRLDQGEAFRVFTEDVGEWYLVNEHTVMDHTKTKTLRFDPWVGGHFRDVYDLDTGEGLDGALITVWDPPRRLVFVDGREMEVEVRFEPAGDGCRVTVTQRGFDGLDPDQARQVREHSWCVHLPRWFEDHVTARFGPVAPMNAAGGAQ